MKIVGISGTIIGSTTSLVTKKILAEIERLDPSMETELLNLKDYQIQFCDGREWSDYNEDTRNVINKISTADLYIIVSPIFHGTFSGALKNLFDLISPPMLKDKIIGFAAVGGNEKHYLMVENQLKPLAGYFEAYVAPRYLFIHSKDIHQEEVLNRITDFSKGIIHMKKLLEK